MAIFRKNFHIDKEKISKHMGYDFSTPTWTTYPTFHFNPILPFKNIQNLTQNHFAKPTSN